MNCQDIALILDDGEVHMRGGELRSAVESHLVGCPACARVWRPLAQFSEVPTPPLPNGFADQCAALVVAESQPGSKRRAHVRPIVLGCLVAGAAAAWILAMRTPDKASAEAGPFASIAAPTIVSETASKPVASERSDTAATDTLPASQGSGSYPAAPAINPFTVQMLPLKSEVVDPARNAAIETVYAVLVEGLRAVPGLNLVGPAANGSEAPVAADYRLRLEGGAVAASAAGKGDYFVRMQAEQIRPDGRTANGHHFGLEGETAPGCVSLAAMDPLASDSSCRDAVGVATGLLDTLRKWVFPPDPQLQRGLQARLADQALDSGARLRALLDLRMLAAASATNVREAMAPVLSDPAVVRAAIQLASTTPDPAARAQVWYSLRGSRDPELVRPLVAALRTDADGDTRVQALETLAADFATDPQVGVAMETAAAADPDPLVRALAQRALGAESGWTEYVLSSLKDADRPPVERIQALFHAYGLPTSRLYGSFDADGRILRELDDAAIRALTEVLPSAAADLPGYARASLTLVSELAHMEHPAITDMLLDALVGGGQLLDRHIALEALRSRTGDARVRAALEMIIVADDADPQFRELAGNILSGGALQPQSAGRPADGTAAATSAPPRLGVMTDYMQPAPDVPPDLIGRLAVVRMSSGSVAVRAGIKEADVLLEINGKPITSGSQLIEVLDALPRDVDVDVLVSRDGQTLRLTARF